MEAVIKPCPSCKDTQAARFQDREYGPHHRVHNPVKKKDGGIEYRCTICRAVRN